MNVDIVIVSQSFTETDSWSSRWLNVASLSLPLFLSPSLNAKAAITE